MISIVGLNRMTLLWSLCRTLPLLRTTSEADAIACIVNTYPDYAEIKAIVNTIVLGDELDQHEYDAIVKEKGAAVSVIADMRSDNARDLDRRYLDALRRFDDARDAISNLNIEAILDPTRGNLAYQFGIRTREMWRGVGDLREHTRQAEEEMIRVHRNPKLANAFYAPKSENELENPAPVIVPVLNDAANGLLHD